MRGCIYFRSFTIAVHSKKILLFFFLQNACQKKKKQVHVFIFLMVLLMHVYSNLCDEISVNVEWQISLSSSTDANKKWGLWHSFILASYLHLICLLKTTRLRIVHHVLVIVFCQIVLKGIMWFRGWEISLNNASLGMCGYFLMELFMNGKYDS